MRRELVRCDWGDCPEEFSPEEKGWKTVVIGDREFDVCADHFAPIQVPGRVVLRVRDQLGLLAQFNASNGQQQALQAQFGAINNGGKK